MLARERGESSLRLFFFVMLCSVPLVAACDLLDSTGPGSEFTDVTKRTAASAELRAQRAQTMAIGTADHASHYTNEQLIAALLSARAAGYLVGSPTIDGAHFQTMVFSTPLQGFAQSVALSTGDATQIPGDATKDLSTGYHPDAFEIGLCDTPVHLATGAVCIPGSDPLGSPDGAESFDVVTLKLTFGLPADAQTLRFDWRFGSEEPPDNVNTGFGDYFRTFLVVDGVVQDIVFLPDASPVTSDNAYLGGFMNAVGGTSLTPLPPYPDPDDVGFHAMMTATQTTTLDASPYAGKQVEIWFRLGDAGDGAMDSGVLLANLDIEVPAVETPPPGPRIVEIDIKPRHNPNTINLRKKRGKVAVAILSTIDFDATQVDPLSVRFGPGGAKEVHKRGHLRDVNKDGLLDMVLHFRIGKTGIGRDDTEACLTGMTLTGEEFRGCDSVRPIYRGRRHDDDDDDDDDRRRDDDDDDRDKDKD